MKKIQKTKHTKLCKVNYKTQHVYFDGMKKEQKNERTPGFAILRGSSLTGGRHRKRETYKLLEKKVGEGGQYIYARSHPTRTHRQRTFLSFCE